MTCNKEVFKLFLDIQEIIVKSNCDICDLGV